MFHNVTNVVQKMRRNGQNYKLEQTRGSVFFFFSLLLLLLPKVDRQLNKPQRGGRREGGRERERERAREREKERERERGGGRERENSNSKTLFYKDCSLGSVKERERERGGGGGYIDDYLLLIM